MRASHLSQQLPCLTLAVQGWHEDIILNVRAFMVPAFFLFNRLLGPLVRQLSPALLNNLADTVSGRLRCGMSTRADLPAHNARRRASSRPTW